MSEITQLNRTEIRKVQALTGERINQIDIYFMMVTHSIGGNR
jgi:hypothetical protein